MAIFANKWVQRVIGIAVILMIISVAAPSLRRAVVAGSKSFINDQLGNHHKVTDVGATRVYIDVSRLEAVGVPVTITKTKQIDNSSEGKLYSGLVNVVASSKADLPIKGIVHMHLTLKQVERKEATKIPSQHVLRLSLPQPVATKDDVSYNPRDLQNVKQGALNRLAAGFFNNQIKVQKVYEDEQPILARAAMSNSGAMTKARKLIRDVANGWISGLPGYKGYTVVITWTGTDLSRV